MNDKKQTGCWELNATIYPTAGPDMQADVALSPVWPAKITATEK